MPPKTPNLPPESLVATVTGAVGILSQVTPLNAEAKQGIVQLATTVIVATTAHGAAVRLGRQKWWKNFAGDTTHPPSPAFARAVMVGLFVSSFLAVAMTVALIVVLT